MLLSWILGGALALGQPPVVAPVPAPSPAQIVSEPLNLSVAVPAPTKAPEPTSATASAPPTRYAIMSGAQGSWLGYALEESRLTVNGWTEFSYTPSTAQGSNLPMGY